MHSVEPLDTVTGEGRASPDSLPDPQTSTAEELREEPTLWALLRSVANAHLPARFYQLLQFALPLAVQFWMWGWRRSAALMLAVSAFGMWALCEQRLDSVDGHSARYPWIRVGRWLGGAVAVITTGGLVAAVVIEILKVVFKCPGCAG